MFRDIENFLSLEKFSLESLARIQNERVVVTDKIAMSKVLHTSLRKFLRSKAEFEKCLTMLDFLRWYNLLDCELLYRAIKNFAAGFLKDWNTNIHRFKSVSSHLLGIILNYFKILISCPGSRSTSHTNTTMKKRVLFIHSGQNSAF